MNFGVSDHVKPLLSKLRLFIQEAVIPNEQKYLDQLEKNRWASPPVMLELRARARQEGLFNLFIEKDGQTRSPVDYAHLADQMGYSEIAAEAFNCAMPDSGNMEILARYGSDSQRAQYLMPLLTGDVTSGFAMTSSTIATGFGEYGHDLIGKIDWGMTA